MGSLRAVLLLLIFTNASCRGEQLDFCGYHLGAIHKGTVSLENANVYHTEPGLRSKVECATACYSDFFCKTAVFQSDGDCLFIRNFTDTLNLVSDDSFTPGTDYVLEMQTKDADLSRQTIETQDVTCSSECDSYSVCFLDCSGDMTEPEGMCMDVTTRQYTEDNCLSAPYIQSKEYYLANLDKSFGGHSEVFSVTFVKIDSSSTLRVRWRGTLRSINSWSRFQIHFNGGNCGNPGYIESMNYNAESDTYHEKAVGIHGVCHGISAGTITISMYVEVHSSNARIGYATHASRMYVDEIKNVEWADKPASKCPSLPMYNLRQHINTGEWSNDHSATLWSVAFRKMDANTWLKINLDFMMRLHTAGSGAAICVIWYIYIDGGNCQPVPIGKTVANLDYANDVNNEHRSGEIEGHCSGISAGDHTISLYVHVCPWGTASGDAHTGWNGCRQRFLIEEYHPGSNIAAVMANDGETLYKVPQFNMISHGLSHPANGADTTTVWTIPNYIKYYRKSGLQVSLSTDGRCYWGHGDSGNWDECCRHYFVINGAECTNPGTIEGIHYLNKRTNLHRPVMIEGICEGIPKGEVTLSLSAGLCKGFGQKGECYFGWNSYVHLLVSESFVDREIIQF